MERRLLCASRDRRGVGPTRLSLLLLRLEQAAAGEAQSDNGKCDPGDPTGTEDRHRRRPWTRVFDGELRSVRNVQSAVARWKARSARGDSCDQDHRPRATRIIARETSLYRYWTHSLGSTDHRAPARLTDNADNRPAERGRSTTMTPRSYLRRAGLFAALLAVLALPSACSRYATEPEKE